MWSVVDSGADCNLMREDFFKELLNAGISMKAEELRMSGKTRHKLISRIRCTTEIDGEVYGLE